MKKRYNFQYISEAYKLFYKENLDFTKKDIEIKIQVMFYILNYFFIDTTYDFDAVLTDSQIPFSKKLEIDFKNMLSLKEIVGNEEIEIKEFTKRKIETIGEMVQKETQNKIENLIDFVITLYQEETEEHCKQKMDLETIAKTVGIELKDIIENPTIAKK